MIEPHTFILLDPGSNMQRANFCNLKEHKNDFIDFISKQTGSRRHVGTLLAAPDRCR